MVEWADLCVTPIESLAGEDRVIRRDPPGVSVRIQSAVISTNCAPVEKIAQASSHQNRCLRTRRTVRNAVARIASAANVVVTPAQGDALSFSVPIRKEKAADLAASRRAAARSPS